MSSKQFSAKERRRLAALLAERDGGFCCHYCGVALVLDGAEHYKNDHLLWIDHKIPISRGGTNHLDNLVLACRRCNIRKRNYTYEDFITGLKRPMMSQFSTRIESSYIDEIDAIMTEQSLETRADVIRWLIDKARDRL